MKTLIIAVQFPAQHGASRVQNQQVTAKMSNQDIGDLCKDRKDPPTAKMARFVQDGSTPGSGSVVLFFLAFVDVSVCLFLSFWNRKLHEHRKRNCNRLAENAELRIKEIHFSVALKDYFSQGKDAVAVSPDTQVVSSATAWRYHLCRFSTYLNQVSDIMNLGPICHCFFDYQRVSAKKLLTPVFGVVCNPT